jgi:ABC-type uncharacterized transport system, ATPase component
MTLSVSHLTRSFGQRIAVNDVSFDVLPGRLTGFVGGNGAGKTTTMRMILGVLAPDSGEVTLRGIPLDQKARRSFGYMPEERGLYPKMGLREQLVYFAMLHGFSKADGTKEADALIEVLGLSERAKDPIENLSLGNQQRAQVAVALVHRPTALILDEPFSGLDPLAVDVIVSVLSARAAEGIPVLLSSHQLDVVERLCDDLVIIADGEVRATGSIDRLRDDYGTLRYRVDGDADLGWIRDVEGVIVTELAGNTAEIEVADYEVANHVLREAMRLGEVFDFSKQNLKLTEIFREVVVDQADEKVEVAK